MTDSKPSFIELFVRDLDGTTMTFRKLDTSLTMKQLKRLVKDRNGVPMAFVWFSGGMEPSKLNNDQLTLAQAGLTNDRTIQLCGRLVNWQVSVEHADGNDDRYYFPGSFAKLRQEIAENCGVPYRDVLLYNRHNQIIRDGDNLNNHWADYYLGLITKVRFAPSAAERECCVCSEEWSDAVPRAVFLPCKHAQCCAGCSQKLITCPICQTAIAETINPFY